MAAITLAVLANSYYDKSNTPETQAEVAHQLSVYRAAPVQAVQASIGALGSHLDLLSSSAQVLCLSVLEEALKSCFASLPDDARGLVYETLLKLALPPPAPPGSSGVSEAVQSVSGKVLARVVAQSYAVTFSPFMTSVTGQLRSGVNVPQALRLLKECLYMWLNPSTGPGSAGSSGDGGSGGGVDPRQASIRLARAAVVSAMPSLLSLLVTLVSARPVLPPAVAGMPVDAAALSAQLKFDRDISLQVLAVLEHLAVALPDPTPLLLTASDASTGAVAGSGDVLRLLSFFASSFLALHLPTASGSQVQMAADTSSSALNVLATLAQRGIRISPAAVPGAGGAGAGAGDAAAAVAGIKSNLLRLAMSLVAGACGAPDPLASPMTGSPSSAAAGAASMATPDLAMTTARLDQLAEMGDGFPWSLREFVGAVVSHVLPAVEAADPGFPSFRLCHLLFTYTLAQPDPDSFCGLLRVWAGLVQRVIDGAAAATAAAAAAPGGAASAEYAHLLARQAGYISVFEGLAQTLLARALFASNAAGLEDLSDELDAGEDFDGEEGADEALVGVHIGAAGAAMGSGAAAMRPASSPGSTGAVGECDISGSGDFSEASGAATGSGSSAVGFGAGSGVRGPPSLHRLTTRSRLPSGTFVLRPLRVSVFAPSATGAGPGAAGVGRFDAEDADDEMGGAAALSVGTALAEAAGAGGDGDDDDAGAGGGVGAGGGSGALGFAGGSGSGAGGEGGDGDGAGMSHRARYQQAALLLLSRLCAIPAVAAVVLPAAMAGLTQACGDAVTAASALAAGGAAAAAAAAAADGVSPDVSLRRHASDAAVLFTLLADVAPRAASAAALFANPSSSPLHTAASLLRLAVAQGWTLRGQGPLARVMAAALIAARAFLPPLNDVLVAAVSGRGAGGSDAAAAAAGAASAAAAAELLPSAASVLSDSIAHALALLDSTVTPPPAGVADAAVAFLAALAQQPLLRVLARSSAVPSLNTLLLTADAAALAVAGGSGSVSGSGSGTAAWTRLMAGLPPPHQAHALVAALRVLLGPQPPALTAAGGTAAASSLATMDPPQAARAAAATALLRPLAGVVSDAVAVGTGAGGGGLAGVSAVVTEGGSIGPRLSRAVGLLCAALTCASDAGVGSVLQGVLASLLGPLLQPCCAAIVQLLEAAANPASLAAALGAGGAAAAAVGARGLGSPSSFAAAGVRPLRASPFAGGGSGAGLGGRSSSGSGAGAPLVCAGELLRLLAACIAAMRRSLPDPFILQMLGVLGPLLSRLQAMAGSDSSSGSGAGSSSIGSPGIAGGSGGAPMSPASSPPSPGPRAQAGLLAALLYLLRLLRACCQQGPVVVGGAGPAGGAAGPAGAASSSAADPSASASLRSSLLAAVTGPVRAMSSPGAFRLAEEVAPTAMTLARAVLRWQWRSLTTAPVVVDAATGTRARAFASPAAAEAAAGCVAVAGAWLGNASASPELFRFALLNVVAAQKETGVWGVAAFRESALPGMEVTLLDALLLGERPTLSDDVLRALVAMAGAHRQDFASRVLPLWMGRCLGSPDAVSSVIARLDDAVKASLASPAATEADYADALLCLVASVRSWRLISSEARAVAAGSTVPVY